MLFAKSEKASGIIQMKMQVKGNYSSPSSEL
jgi:hypothetical protein